MTAISTYCSLFRTVLSEQAENSDGTVAGHFPDGADLGSSDVLVDRG